MLKLNCIHDSLPTITGDVLVGTLPFARSCPDWTYGRGFGCDGSNTNIRGDVSGLHPGGISIASIRTSVRPPSFARRTWSGPYVATNVEIAESINVGVIC
jgi:hypothetical protein